MTAVEVVMWAATALQCGLSVRHIVNEQRRTAEHSLKMHKLECLSRALVEAHFMKAALTRQRANDVQ